MIGFVNLPDFHKDPFDRLLIAQAVKNNFFFVTKDKTIQCKNFLDLNKRGIYAKYNSDSLKREYFCNIEKS